MKRLAIFLLISGVFPLMGGFETLSLEFRESDIRLGEGEAPSLFILGGISIGSPGKPDLPYVRFFIILPVGQRAVSLKVRNMEEEVFSSGIKVKPFEIPAVPGVSSGKVVEEDSLYGVDAIYPPRVVELKGTQYVRGIPLAVVNVFPLRYLPLDSLLFFVRRVDFDLFFEEGEGGLLPRKQSLFSAKVAESLLKSKVLNPEKSQILYQNVEPFGNPLRTSHVPSGGDSPIAEVIITTDEMAPRWEEFASYRTMMGVPTVVRTTSFIESSYPGVDRAERMRNFVKDAYLNWGIIFLLLGGDALQVPVRIVHEELPGEEDPLFTNFPSDYYFGCLEGTWNGDGDTVFGEEEDSVDFLPEVLVVRVPATSILDVENYVKKAKTYEGNPGNGEYSYLEKALFVGSDLFEEGDGCSLVQEASTHTPGFFFNGYLCEDEMNSPTTEEFVDSLYSGYNYVVVQAHGNFLDFNVCNSPKSTFSTSDADLMENWWNASIVHLVSCEPLGFDFDCIGEHMMRSTGCAVGLMGSARLSYSGYGLDYQKGFFDSLFIEEIDRLGPAFYSSALPFLPTPGGNVFLRYIYPSYIVMGDPALVLWDSIPLETIVSFSPESLFTSPQSLEVSVRRLHDNHPLEDVLVVGLKEEEVFTTAYTNSEGEAILFLAPSSPGSLALSVTGKGTLPQVSYLPVKRSSVSLSVVGLLLEDEEGDSVAEPRETLLLYPIVQNSGTEESGPSVLYLEVQGSHLSLVKDTVHLPSIPPGDSLMSSSYFSTFVSYFPPDSYVVPLKITSISQETLSVDTERVIIRAPMLSHYGHSLEENSDTFLLSIALLNKGGGDAEGVFGKIYTEHADFLVDSVSFGDIPKKGILPDSLVTPFTFFSQDSISALTFTLIIGDKRGILDTFQFKVSEFRGPQELQFAPLIGGVRLYWEPMAGEEHLGYFVYRSTDSTGNFSRLNLEPFPMCFYEDFDVVPRKSYFYRVSLVDTFWNESPPGITLRAHSSLEAVEGWPQYLGPSSSTPLVANIVRANEGLEILVGGNDGILRLFDRNGNLMPGWPLSVGGMIVGSPACGDIDGDGNLEIVVAPWSDTSMVFAFEEDGTPVSGWPRPIPGGSNNGNQGVYAPPVVVDLDRDSVLEVIVKTMSGSIYVWKGTGEGFLDPSGFFFDLGVNNWSLSSLSVGDVNGDEYPEIVAGTSIGELHLLNLDGEELPGFPLRSLDPIKSAVVIADFVPDSLGLEIVAVGSDSMWLVDSKGKVLPGWPVPVPRNTYSWYFNPSVADIDLNGSLDILINTSDGISVFNVYGQEIGSFAFSGGTSSSATVVDLDLDNTLDAFSGSLGDGLRGIRLPSGESPLGFPIPLTGSMDASPVVADLDSDGELELIVYSGDGNLWVFDLSSPYEIDSLRFPWPTHRHDIQRTGCFSTPQTGIGISEKGITSLNPRGGRIRLLPVRPNPSSGRTVISFLLPERAEVSLRIYNSSGRRVKDLLQGPLTPGTHRMEWDGRDQRGNLLPRGVYFVTLKVRSQLLHKKILLLKE